jgi:acetoin utilization deacetylase AcuC-like enzyme
MNTINVFFKPQMQKENKSFSPSASKPALVVQDWKALFNEKISIVSFDKFNQKDFYHIHDKNYVDGIFNGNINNGFGIKDADFSSTFLETNASLYYASLDALNNQIAISPTSGFHHARYDRSEGFCTFNGLVLTALRLKNEGKAQKIGILDFDMHYGNGTDEIIKKLNLDFIVHYTAGKQYDLYYPSLNFLKPVIKLCYNSFFTASKSQKEIKKPILRQKLLQNKGDKFINTIPKILEAFKDCDLIIYQAGADQHIDDPYGGLLTYEKMSQRDNLVFSFAKKMSIPLVWNLAGGYQKDSQGSIEPVLKCHRNTMYECLKIYS